MILSLLVLLLLGILLMPAWSVAGPAQTMSLQACAGGAFSTEEDFIRDDLYFSDGDLLSFTGQVCARNADLLDMFYPRSDPPADLGLDAADILDIDRGIVAFSTELDDLQGGFTAGDLLFTNGAVIPNQALVYAFGIRYDIGLDGVHFVGQAASIQDFAEFAPTLDPDEWVQRGRLQQELQNRDIDIWFTIEGTFPMPDAPDILDGDLLSAMGFIVRSNGNLLLSVPVAGLPDGGVDFGLDAVSAARLPGPEPFSLRFSTEILYRGLPSFNDGDVLMWGGSIVTLHEVLIQPFDPAADFLGLDALYFGREEEPEPMITLIGNRSVWDIDGGWVPINDPGTGLFWHGLSAGAPTPPRRPFGRYVPIDGYLTNDIVEFRVAMRKASNPALPPGTARGIQTSWRTWQWYPTSPHCRDTGTFQSGPGGWINAATYRLLRGTTVFCPNSGLVLAVWDTLNDVPDDDGDGIPDRDDHYVIWLEWRTSSGGATVYREPVDHHVQLDNTAPRIDQLELRTPDGTVIEPCGGAEAGTQVLEAFGDFYDEYFEGYRLRVRGGNPPEEAWYPMPPDWHQYWEGPPFATHLNEQGTTPAGLQHLGDIDMNDLGSSFTACCYVLDLWVKDSAIRHNFDGLNAWPQQPGWAWPNSFRTFAASP
jgi:hypothetical protein